MLNLFDYFKKRTTCDIVYENKMKRGRAVLPLFGFRIAEMEELGYEGGIVSGAGL